MTYHRPVQSLTEPHFKKKDKPYLQLTSLTRQQGVAILQGLRDVGYMHGMVSVSNSNEVVLLTPLGIILTSGNLTNQY